MFVHGGHPTHVHTVLILARHQRCARGTTSRRVSKAGVAKTIGGQRVEMGRLYFPSITTQVRISQIVRHYKDDIRSGFRSGNKANRYSET
jgi:hypothetical protein